MLIVSIAASLLLLFLLGVYAIYRICFGEYRERYPEDDIEKQMPKGPAYEVFEETIKRGILNVVEAKEYETIESDIAALEEKIEKLESDMMKFATDFVKLREITEEKEKAELLLEEKMDRWMYLEDLAKRIAEQ